MVTNMARLRKLERRASVCDDGTARVLVGMLETPDGLHCDSSAVHASVDDAARAHRGRGVMLLVERIVSA